MLAHEAWLAKRMRWAAAENLVAVVDPLVEALPRSACCTNGMPAKRCSRCCDPSRVRT